MSKSNLLKNHKSSVRRISGILIFAAIILAGSSIDFDGIFANSTKDIANTNYKQAPEFGKATWINSKQLKMKDLKGKVVLVHFWTYSCKNCEETLPYVKKCYEKYKDKGLVVVGVHTPEFSKEGDLENVKKAVTKREIDYPVLVDSSKNPGVILKITAGQPTVLLIKMGNWCLTKKVGTNLSR